MRYYIKLLLAIVGLTQCYQGFAQTAEFDNASKLYYKSVSGGFAVTTKNTSQSTYTGDIVIPDNVKPGTRTFYGKVIGIDNFAFNKSTITSISLPPTLLSIGEHAFTSCKNLSTINLPSSVNSIGIYAFSEMTKLTSITIPSSVTNIDYRILDGCSNLQTVYSNITDPDGVIHRSAFEGIPSSTILYVPYGSKSKYSNMSNLKNCFKEIKEYNSIDNVYTLTIKTDGNGSVSYSGYNIFKYQALSFSVKKGESAMVAFNPNNGYRIKSIKVNGIEVTSSVSNNQYTISNFNTNITLEAEFEEITYLLSIKTTDNGSATYNGTVIRNLTKTFIVKDGSSATISLSPDDGYKIKSVKVNGSDVTSSVIDNQYTISSITTDTSVEVEFEIMTYTLSIKAIGNGSVSYDGTTIKDNTSTFTINHGTSATISLSPDDNYRIKSVKVNGTDVTSSIKDNQYTISSITADTSVEVEFAIITYTLSIKAIGNGSVSYDGTTIKDNTSTFTINHGTSATISLSPDDNYRIKSVKVNGTDVTSSIKDNQYTISSITADTSVEVEFAIITYTLSIKATGNGSASYDGTTIKDKASTFTVNHGTSATITFTPDDGYKIKSVKVNGVDMTSSVKDNSYTINSITADTSVEVEFAIITYTLSIKATGNGSASYDGTTIKDKASTFTVNHGASATITFSLEDGYRIKFVKVNEVDVSSSVVDNQYTISNITAETSLNVEFEAIPPTTYTLSIKVTGNGSATYAKTVIRDKESTFTVNEGSLVSIIITPDNGYKIKRVIENETNVTSYVSNGTYIINSISRNTNVEVEFEAIPPMTYTLSIKATGNGVASYDGATIKNLTSTFTINEGASATISFSPDNGYRIKSVKANDTDVTSSVSSNSYTINKISANTTLEVEFEAIPPTTYTLEIMAIGNGTASYDGTTMRNKTSFFTVNEGAAATVSFNPDKDHRIKSVTVNGMDVTSNVSNNQYTISSITAATTLKVEFEAIPPTTYTLTIKAIGNGSVSYDGTSIRKDTSTFTVKEGTSASISFSPDNGYRIKSVIVNNTDVTSSVSSNTYTINKISANITLEVEFEEIPIPTYTLSINVSGNGSASYDGTSVRNGTRVFTVNEGASATIYFSPDNGNRLSVVKVNGEDVTSQTSGNLYTISNITANITMDVAFVEDLTALTVDGVNYKVVSQSERTIHVVGGNYGHVLTVPKTVTSDGRTWTVVGIESTALNGNAELAAIIWNPEMEFKATVSNPNLLLYVKAEQYAPTSIQNVIVNGVANNIVLKEAGSGNTFYCPQSFTAQRISYTHYYQMQTGVGESRGWETIALPFDVQTITHETKGPIVPFASWKRGDNAQPFWLYELTGSGFEETNSIKANTPYIISMPNHPQYDSQWWLNGNVTFAASEVSIAKSEDLNEPIFQDRTFVPCFTDKASDAGVYALNVNNEFEKNNSGMTEGSKFVLNMRRVHPFEAYMTSSSSAHYAIDIFEDMTTGIRILEEERRMSEDNTYDLQGQRVAVPNKRGVYIVNGKKQIIK